MRPLRDKEKRRRDTNMARTANTILDLIGDTPVVRLNRLTGPNDATVWVKLEYFNPLGSVKDRICAAMIEAAEAAGELREGMTLVEPTSGNTGIGLAMVAAVKGYRLVLTMPDSMSVERRKLLKALGAEIVLTPGAEGMRGAVNAAAEMARTRKDHYMPQQFRNPANPEAHRRTTALEILEQTGGKVDAFVAGVGTGGTLTGVGEVLKSKLKDVLIVAVEPAGSPVLSGGAPGPHGIQGIGAGFVPDVLNRDVVDEIVKISETDAVETARRLAREEAVFAGISAGANVCAALQTARRLGAGRTVVTVACDTGERYLSTQLFEGL